MKISDKNRLAPVKQKKAYPHVYDSNLEAKLSAGNISIFLLGFFFSFFSDTCFTILGFISGTKVLLPENHKRKDTKMYEEVYIPASPPTLPSLEEDKILISSLDKVIIQNFLETSTTVNFMLKFYF